MSDEIRYALCVVIVTILWLGLCWPLIRDIAAGIPDYYRQQWRRKAK